MGGPDRGKNGGCKGCLNACVFLDGDRRRKRKWDWLTVNDSVSWQMMLEIIVNEEKQHAKNLAQSLCLLK